MTAPWYSPEPDSNTLALELMERADQERERLYDETQGLRVARACSDAESPDWWPENVELWLDDPVAVFGRILHLAHTEQHEELLALARQVRADVIDAAADDITPEEVL